MARVLAGSRPDRGNRMFIVLAVLFALIAAVLVFAVLNSRGGDKASSSAEAVDVVVARGDIPAGTRLTADALKVAPVPPDSLLQGTYADATPLVGFVTRYPIAAGEQITLAKVGLETEDKEGLSFIVPAGKRAMAVSVTQVSSVGGLLLPGDRVDIIVVFRERDQSPVSAVTLFQSVEVLAVAQMAQELAPPPPDSEEDSGEAGAAEAQPLSQRPEDAEPQPLATTVTLALSPAQTQLFALAQEEGMVWLALRPFGETDEVELAEVTLPPPPTP